MALRDEECQSVNMSEVCSWGNQRYLVMLAAWIHLLAVIYSKSYWWCHGLSNSINSFCDWLSSNVLIHTQCLKPCILSFYSQLLFHEFISSVILGVSRFTCVVVFCAVSQVWFIFEYELWKGEALGHLNWSILLPLKDQIIHGVTNCKKEKKVQ